VGGFHDLRGPTADGAVMRYSADLGSTDGYRTIRALASRLRAIQHPRVIRLVLGTETVG
jgi:hypothetical protein